MSITPSSRDDLQKQIQQRSPEAAIAELHNCIAAVSECMAALAEMFPGCKVICGFTSGQPVSTLALARAANGYHFADGALDSAKHLARIAAALPMAFAYQLEIEIRQTRERAEEKTATAASTEHDLNT